MDIQQALNERILARVLNEAVRRGDVVMVVDHLGEQRFSIAVKEPPAVSQHPQ